MPNRRRPTDCELRAQARDLLNDAYRLLGDATDCLRGLGHPDALNAIGDAKTAINQAKDSIRA